MNEKWATARYARSGDIVRWLGTVRGGGVDAITKSCARSERWTRRWMEWRRNPDVAVLVSTTLDEFLCFLDIPLSAAPDWIFTERNQPHGKNGKKHLSAAKIRQLVEHADKHGVKSSAKKFSLTQGAVRYHVRNAKKAKGEKVSRHPSSEAIDAAAREYMSRGDVSLRHLAAEYGVGRSSIRRRVERFRAEQKRAPRAKSAR